MAWNKPQWSNVDDLKRDIDKYFRHCRDTRSVRELKNGDIRLRQESPTMIGLANWLGVSKQTIYNYLNDDGNTQGHSEETYRAIFDVLSQAKARIEQGILDRTIDGDTDPRIGQMILSHFGYDTGKNEPTAITVTVAGLPEQVSEWSK